ncbi:hypothetical protein CY0110_00740 [Crocosphaera chwakensis CCY0110]|uniref:Uncharacterized protein n=1 Tax=Crocosphaera chwakensis CCY0110 TaxID=391612 RepID=A3IWP5_9CHRO|nr:hypothetical protein CY0110_00740 [Crocosphaera chwakensis CCY0110]
MAGIYYLSTPQNINILISSLSSLQPLCVTIFEDFAIESASATLQAIIKETP